MTGHIWVSAISEILKGMEKFEKSNPGSLHPDAVKVVFDTLRVIPAAQPEPRSTHLPQPE